MFRSCLSVFACVVCAATSSCPSSPAGWPTFSSEADLEKDPWGKYFQSIYGRLPPPSQYPFSPGCLWIFYDDIVAKLGVTQLPKSSGDCPLGGGVEGQRYNLNNIYQPEHVSWSWHPYPYSGFQESDWVEVTHVADPFGDEHYGAWLLYAKGSGIWLNIGKTKIFQEHQDAYSYFNVQTNEALARSAAAQGLDSLQFVAHADPVQYQHCDHKHNPQSVLEYMNIEILGVKLAGTYACTAASGAPPIIKAGWQASEPCQCNNTWKQLNCQRTPKPVPSLWPPRCSNAAGAQHGWPVFHNASELASNPQWSKYFQLVYGDIPSIGYPICAFDFKILYRDALAGAGIQVTPTKHCTQVGTLSEFWTIFSGYEDWFYFMYHGWPGPPNAAAPSNVWVEVVHAIAALEVDGAWYFHMPGSGIWIYTGNTKSYASHQDMWDGIMGPGNDCEHTTPKFSCGNVMFKKALHQLGLSTVQLTAGTDCNEGLQIVDTAGYGAETCARSSLRSGWQAMSQCTCESSYRALNCDELAFKPLPLLKACPAHSIQKPNYQYGGGGIVPKQRAADADECCKVCASSTSCTYWHFNPGDGIEDHRCHMFSGVPTSGNVVTNIPGYVAGINSCAGVRECHRSFAGKIIPKQAASSPDECCFICTSIPTCSIWIYNPGGSEHCHMFYGQIDSSQPRCENQVPGMSGGYIPQRLTSQNEVDAGIGLAVPLAFV